MTLLKKTGGKFVEVVEKEPTTFRGAWSPDELAYQYTFANGIPSEFVPDFHPTAGLAPVAASVSSFGYGGTPGPFTGAVKLPVANLSDAAYTQLSLDLSTLGITNISRVSAWFGTGSFGGNPQDYFREEIRVNNVVKAATVKGMHPWVEISASATEADVVSFRYECDYTSSIAWASHGGMTGVKIFNRSEPYMLGHFVTHDGEMWESLIDNNGDTPSKTSNSWTRAITLPAPRGTTAARPDAATAGAGFMYYDTTLGKPTWSNGTAWTDSAGTVV